MNPEHAELAARVLHRCVLGAPAGSDVYRRAMADLALLDNLGLEPLTLARKEPADAYLTRKRKRPPTDNLVVKVDGKARTHSRTYKNWLKKLESDDVRSALVPCWTTYWRKAHKKTLELTVPFHYHFRLDKWDDFDRSLLDIQDKGAPSGEALGAAYSCVTEALAPIADEYSKKSYEGTWNAEITLTIGPSS
jgi:hypothetical protein